MKKPWKVWGALLMNTGSTTPSIMAGFSCFAKTIRSRFIFRIPRVTTWTERGAFSEHFCFILSIESEGDHRRKFNTLTLHGSCKCPTHFHLKTLWDYKLGSSLKLSSSYISLCLVLNKHRYKVAY